MKANYVTLIINLFFILTANAQDSTDWKLAKEQDGIKVFTKKANDSSFKTFKAVIELNNTKKSIERVLLDFENYRNWVYKIEKSDVIEVISDNTKLVHLCLGTPWPVSDRDVILEYDFNKGFEKSLITMNCKPKSIPEEEGLVRIVKAIGSWELIKLTENKTRVTYTFLADPNGNLPSMIVNMFVVEGPFETLSNLKDQL